MLFELENRSAAPTKTFLIAEIGINHGGNFDKARMLIESAWRCGASAAKLQSYITEKRVPKDSPIYDILKRCELSFEQQQKLFEFGAEIGIEVFSTPFDDESVDFLDEINCKIIKIASFDATNKTLLRKINSLNTSIVMSTGMTNQVELLEAIDIFGRKIEEKRLAVLHCISAYPTDPTAANLNSISALKDLVSVPVGYSDHTIGWRVPFYAVFAGATIIEKHFTLNCDDDGPDHKLSADPATFAEMVRKIREAELIMGEKTVNISDSEKYFLQYKRTTV